YAARFERYLKARKALCGTPSDQMICPSEPGLVSIVLPVFNGGDLLQESLNSILAQTYENFELIAIDDGSTDGSAEILDRYAERDSRIRVVHQENQKLPRSLSNGFRLARGQFLTWTSHDNRLKPDFLEKMVNCLHRHPNWDMAYANMDIVGDDGLPLIGSGWYFGYQEPRGSQHIHLPAIRGELNTWPNNYVGAAFLYRDRVAALLGDYGADRFTVEDYDYWMQVNELLELHHVDFDEPVYEYRFHERSLTTREDDAKMLALRDRVMVFDDFRRDFALSAMVWILNGFPEDGPGQELVQGLRRRLKDAGHLELILKEIDPDELPALWFPTAYLQWASSPENASPPRDRLPRHALCVLVTDSADALPHEMPKEWDLCVTVAPSPTIVRTARAYQGWYGLGDAAAVFAAADIRTRMQQFRALEEESRRVGEGAPLEATVVISTYRRREDLEQLLRSLARQTVPMDRFEVLVVNNDPADDIAPVIARLRDELFASHPDHLRSMVCPLPGLSHARNAGIGAARGEIVAFIDDDAVAAPDWLEHLLAAYRSDPELGVVGGRILLVTPDPAPSWLDPEAWPLWGYLNPRAQETYTVDSWADFPWGGNWSARKRTLLEIGGFRYGYGRRADNYGGGEEIVAASLAQRIGAKIAVEPRATIEHHPDRSRFTPEYVRKTIRAGTLVSYYLQRDLYVPEWQKPLDVLEQIGSRVFHIITGRGDNPFRRMEQRARLRADIALLRIMVADSRRQARVSS
ncbi:MAG: glycosyltransferase, partial [Acidobacteria bacterium]|nr:glycosyltransferase [Acidobacteriota bacterium]